MIAIAPPAIPAKCSRAVEDSHGKRVVSVDLVERDSCEPCRPHPGCDDRWEQPQHHHHRPGPVETEQIAPRSRPRDEQDDADRDHVGDDRLLHAQSDRRQSPGDVGCPAMRSRPPRRGDVHEHQHARPGHRADQRSLGKEELGVEDRGTDDQRGEHAGDAGPPARTGEAGNPPTDGDHRRDGAHEGNQVDRGLRVAEIVGHDPVDPVLHRRFVVPGSR